MEGWGGVRQECYKYTDYNKYVEKQQLQQLMVTCDTYEVENEIAKVHQRQDPTPKLYRRGVFPLKDPLIPLIPYHPY